MKPGSGYDIKNFCDKTISHFWNENFGQENIRALITQHRDIRRL
jgi:hypothetical protein